MSNIIYEMNLSWKSFNVDLNTVEAWLKANAGPDYVGESAGSGELVLFFTNEPAQQYKDAINTYWAGLNLSSTESTNYKSETDRKSSAVVSRSSAITKLQNLGLTDSEIQALLG